MNEVWEFLKAAQTYYLATIDNGKARVRPFGTAEIFEGKLYIQTGKKKPVYAQIMENPWVEICAYKDGSWLRVSGKLVADERIEAKKDMLDKNPSLRAMYDENDDNTIVFYFEDATATFSSFTAPTREVEF